MMHLVYLCDSTLCSRCWGGAYKKRKNNLHSWAESMKHSVNILIFSNQQKQSSTMRDIASIFQKFKKYLIFYPLGFSCFYPKSHKLQITIMIFQQPV